MSKPIEPLSKAFIHEPLIHYIFGPRHLPGQISISSPKHVVQFIEDSKQAVIRAGRIQGKTNQALAAILEECIEVREAYTEWLLGAFLGHFGISPDEAVLVESHKYTEGGNMEITWRIAKREDV